MNMSNPARLSSDFQGLFPPGVIAAAMTERGRVELLLPAEAACLGRSVPERQQEFAAGRLCARRALEELGIQDFPLIAQADRQPVWPAEIIGSITHTQGLCAAVAGRRSHFAGLGIDSEVVGRVTAELRQRICVPEELAWIDSLAPALQASASALVFAAKEAFYKCQSPMTGQWLGFHDLKVETVNFGAAIAQGTVDTFRIVPIRNKAFAALAGTVPEGRYRFEQEYVSAGVVITA
jgi:4'-phosphopantetheinyl transferase EntD